MGNFNEKMLNTFRRNTIFVKNEKTLFKFKKIENAEYSKSALHDTVKKYRSRGRVM